MAIEGVTIEGPGFRIAADEIRQRAVLKLIDTLSAEAPASRYGASLLGDAPAGAGAIRPPAEQFAAARASDPAALQAGFAPGGGDPQKLDANGFMNLLMQFLRRLFEALLQILLGGNTGGQNTGQGNGTGTCNRNASNTGGPRPSTGATPASPSKPARGTPAAPRSTPSKAPAAPETPPSNDPGIIQCSTRDRPDSYCLSVSVRPCKPKEPGLWRRIACKAGKVALAAGTGMATGNLPGAATAVAASFRKPAGRTQDPGQAWKLAETPPRVPAFEVASTGSERPYLLNHSPSIATSSVGGGRFEDRLFEFLSARLKQLETEVDAAIKESEADQGSGSDSRTAATLKVQQLSDKRKELVEQFSNTMRAWHDSNSTIARNIR